MHPTVQMTGSYAGFGTLERIVFMKLCTSHGIMYTDQCAQKIAFRFSVLSNSPIRLTFRYKYHFC